MPDISFDCDGCGQNLAVDETGAGVAVACPKCQKELTVPLWAKEEKALPLGAEIHFVCRRCDKHIAVDVSQAGKLINCPKCDGFIKAPLENQSEPVGVKTTSTTFTPSPPQPKRLVDTPIEPKPDKLLAKRPANWRAPHPLPKKSPVKEFAILGGVVALLFAFLLSPYSPFAKRLSGVYESAGMDMSFGVGDMAGLFGSVGQSAQYKQMLEQQKQRMSQLTDMTKVRMEFSGRQVVFSAYTMQLVGTYRIKGNAIIVDVIPDGTYTAYLKPDGTILAQGTTLRKVE